MAAFGAAVPDRFRYTGRSNIKSGRRRDKEKAVALHSRRNFGRAFCAPTGAHQVAELGLIDRTIHKVNEHIAIDHLDRLSRIYKTIVEQILLKPAFVPPGDLTSCFVFGTCFSILKNRNPGCRLFFSILLPVNLLSSHTLYCDWNDRDG